MKLIDKSQCTGCGACANICKKSAITMINDDEGFLVPHIDQNLCIECSACLRVCPCINDIKKTEIQSVFAVQLKNENLLMNSTSGGAFTAIAMDILNKNGVVYGCVWDEKYNAVFQRTETIKGLEPMRGSKYVSSYAGDVFPEIKKYLTEGRSVLFAGLACQNAGLKSYLQEEYENLYSVDFLCGGTPSPLAFREYLKTICDDNYKELNLKFRDKTQKGWGVHISFNSNHKNFHQQPYINSYFRSYYEKMFHRRCCFDCRYKYTDRTTDITIGDFWGIQKYHSGLDIKKGVSVFFINSEKGQHIFNNIKDKLYFIPSNIKNASDENALSLRRDPSNKGIKISAERGHIFNDLKKNGWNGIKKYLSVKERLRFFVMLTFPYPLINFIKKIKKIFRNTKKLLEVF